MYKGMKAKNSGDRAFTTFVSCTFATMDVNVLKDTFLFETIPSGAIERCLVETAVSQIFWA